MMLPRKRPRPNPAEAATRASATAAVAPGPTTSQSQAPPSDQMSSQRPANGKPAALAAKDRQQELKKAKSWYGSWPRQPKASASLSVAKENILGGTVKSNKAPDLSRFETRKGSDAASVYSTAETLSGPSRSNENKTKIEPTMPKTEPSNAKPPLTEQDDKPAANKTSASTEQPATPKQTVDNKSQTPATTVTTPPRPTTSAGWLGWWSRTPLPETQVAPDSDLSKPTDDAIMKESDVARPVTPPGQVASEGAVGQPPQSAPPASTSWFGFWYASDQTPTKPEIKPETAQEQVPSNVTEDSDVTMTDAPPMPPPPRKHEPAPKAGSTWAFWSKDSPKTKGAAPEPESGEIAVIGEGSEAHPKPMEESDMSPTKSKPPAKTKDTQTGGKSTWRRNKRVRPPSMDIDSQSRSASGASTPTNAQESTQPIEPPTKVIDSSSKSISEAESATKSTPNLLLPSFSSTYQMKENPSILKQVAQFLLRTEQSPPNHVFRLKEPPKIHKAIAIGVHGFFPATYLRPMIGQPTGTSLRFASLGAEAIRRWADAHGCGDCEIEKVALEGEGKINDRVENLWKLMLNWIDHIRSADLIIIACHSQGVPVSVMLLEKLIDLGIITNAKIGVCAMAGVALGPFPEYKSGLLMGSAAELWEFGNPESNVSKRFENALQRVVDYGTRITFIGSIDDQLVPMESAVYSPANHPYIYRAVFIDGRVHAPDFIAHLVGFALKLRNLGVSDHGLIRELSIPLAGSLYSGEGHSRLYFDSAVYDLAVSHALETTNVGPNTSCDISKREALGTPNPYVLPWIMRGLLEEDFVKTELNRETEELLRQFDDWKPANKALKDVKYRLEAVRSKL